MDLVTLEEASDHLRIDVEEDNFDIKLKISAASSAVRNYLKSASPYQKDEDGEIKLGDDGKPIVLFEVKAAVLLLVGEFDINREGEQSGEIQSGYGYLPRPVVALLYPLRDPAIA